MWGVEDTNVRGHYVIEVHAGGLRSSTNELYAAIRESLCTSHAELLVMGQKLASVNLGEST